MKLAPVLLLGAACLVGGCHGDDDQEETMFMADMNRTMVRFYKSDAAERAVVRQATFYPYHFRANSALLNHIGQQDVFALASRYEVDPGPLHVIQGDAPDDLYARRVQSVLSALAEAGVNTDDIEADQGMSGGDGLSSQQVRKRHLEPRSEGGASTPSMGGYPQ